MPVVVAVVLVVVAALTLLGILVVGLLGKIATLRRLLETTRQRLEALGGLSDVG